MIDDLPKSDVEKGRDAHNQIKLWDRLLELRIRMQNMLSISNQLPQNETFKEICQAGQSKTAVQNSTRACKTLLNNLNSLQEVLIKEYPDTKKLLKRKLGDNEEEEDEDDEEITSSEDEPEDKDSEDEENTKKKAKLLKLEEYDDKLKSIYDTYSPFKDKTIQKWNEKTQITSLKPNNKKDFSAFQTTTLKQIEHILTDRERLLKRTQTKRSDYDIVGKTESADSKEDEPENIDFEIFDDDDFYHQLLREIIEKKTSNITDPIQLGRHWLELQKLRKKTKKKVDTRASKSRKIRYDVHPKLVNFMAPQDNSTMAETAFKELMNSLFGKK